MGDKKVSVDDKQKGSGGGGGGGGVRDGASDAPDTSSTLITADDGRQYKLAHRTAAGRARKYNPDADLTFKPRIKHQVGGHIAYHDISHVIISYHIVSYSYQDIHWYRYLISGRVKQSLLVYPYDTQIIAVYVHGAWCMVYG